MTEKLTTHYRPLYQQIKSFILQALDQGEWKPGEMIPSELDLAGRFQVSQGTVRKAIDELVSDNILMRRQGKGTYVCTHHEDTVRFRFLRLTPNEGDRVPAVSRFLDCKRLRATTDIARGLELRTGDSVVMIKRILMFNQQATVVEEIFLPGNLFKGLTYDKLATYRGALYGFFETEYGVRMISADEKIRAVAASAAEVDALQVAQGDPLLFVERISCTYGDRPVELRRGWYRTDQHFYENHLS